MKHFVISVLVLVVSCDRPLARPICPCTASAPPKPAPIIEARPGPTRHHVVYALVAVERGYSAPVNAVLNSYRLQVVEPRRSDLSFVLFEAGSVRLKQGQLFVAEIDTEHPRENCFLSATEGDVIRMTAVTNQAQGIEQLALISRAGWVTSPDDIRARL